MHPHGHCVFWQLPEAGNGGQAKWVKRVKRYKPLGMSHGEGTYSTATVINTVLHIGKWLTE